MIDVPDDLQLTARQARVLGCLIEKAATTPDAYPLTLNALTTACNQTTNRDPIVSYTSSEVETAVLELKALGLARVVHPGSGERATKYRHIADEGLRLESAELAIMGVLLVRGAQTVPELRSRTERYHGFGSVGEVESTLRGLADRTRPLVADVGRQTGQREDRWIQLIEVDAETRALAVGSGGSSGGGSAAAAAAAAAASAEIGKVNERLDRLERRLDALIEALGDLVDLPG